MATRRHPSSTAASTSETRYKIRERRARILEQLQVVDFVGVEDLAEHFEVSVQSIRRDLTSMAEEGLILRKRGGATRPPLQGPVRDFTTDSAKNAAAKSRIAQAAVDLIARDTVAFFYSGSTVARTVALLPDEVKDGLTMVSNSLPVIQEVSAWPDPHLLAVGGLFLPNHLTFVGPQAVSSYRGMRADVAVLGASGLSAAHGFTTPHHLIAEVGQVIVDNAEHVVVVADHSKIGRSGLTPIAPLESIDTLITDNLADPTALDALRKYDIEIRVV